MISFIAHFKLINKYIIYRGERPCMEVKDVNVLVEVNRPQVKAYFAG